MAKNIIAIIGPRKSGKTEVAMLLKSFFPEAVQSIPYARAFNDYIKIHNIPRELFFIPQEVEENKSLLMSFRELQWEKYLTLFSEDLNRMNNIIVDEVYYFAELKLLIQLGAKVIYVSTPEEKRKEFGLTPYMEKQFYAQQVAAIKVDEVKKWSNTIILNNTQNQYHLRGTLRSLI